MAKSGRLGWIAASVGAACLAAGVAHAVVVKGRGELLARGSGFAVLELRGGVAASGIGLAVVEEERIVETSGEGRLTPLGDGRVLLEGFGGFAVRSLEEPTRVEVAGARLRIRARGVGIARLVGAGHYTTDDAEGRWAPDLEVELEAGE
jgi:hypothetical protein